MEEPRRAKGLGMMRRLKILLLTLATYIALC
jgi:hypothetical protein